MKPAPFRYYAPDTLDEAIDLLGEHGHDAKLLAGGQSLVPAMNFRLATPHALIDLNRIDELDWTMESNAGGLRIGAMTRQRTVERSDRVRELQPLLHETMPHIAHLQIRNRGTIGGSIAHADPAGELPAIAVALDATLTMRSLRGERAIAARDFFIALFTTDLASDEILTEIELPPLPANTGTAFAEFARRSGDYAIAGCAAVIRLSDAGIVEEARLVYMSIGDTPIVAPSIQALVGAEPTPERIADAARAAATFDIDPLGDMHATAAYRRHLAQTLAKRVLTVASQRAQTAQKNGERKAEMVA